MTRGRPIRYSDDELAWIEERRELPRELLHAVFVYVFDRPDVRLSNLNSLCKRKGWLTGRTGRIERGQTPWNKGGRMPAHPNSRRTQFKAGQEPHNTKHLGHERLSKEGYVEISVPETNPHTGYPRRYVQKHRWLWERKNGPVPDGYCLKCLDGDKTNTDPGNWTAIPRALLPRLNGRFGRDYDNAPPELKPVIMRIARLEHAAREAKKAGA